MIPTQLGPWKVSNELGKGEFSSVYACARADPSTGADDPQGVRWAMKASPWTEPAMKKKETKPQASCRLIGWEYQLYVNHVKDHPNFPKRPSRQYYSEKQNGWRYLVIERIDGGTLRDRLDNLGKGMRRQTVYSVGLRLLSALRHLHSKEYVFRDIKPENVMTLDPVSDVEGRGVVLVDLGACTKFMDRGRQKTEGEAGAGTPLYMSRHAMQSLAPGRRDDLEALGYLMGYLLNGGHLPWSGAKSEGEILAKKSDPKSVDEMCAGFPELKKYMDTVLKLKLGEETPSVYEKLEKILKEAGGESEGPIEWREAESKTLGKKTSSSALSKARVVQVLSDDGLSAEESDNEIVIVEDYPTNHRSKSSSSSRRSKNTKVISDEEGEVNKPRRSTRGSTRTVTDSAIETRSRRSTSSRRSSKTSESDEEEEVVEEKKPAKKMLSKRSSKSSPMRTPKSPQSPPTRRSKSPPSRGAQSPAQSIKTETAVSRKRKRSPNGDDGDEDDVDRDASSSTVEVMRVSARRQGPPRKAKKLLMEAGLFLSLVALVVSTTRQ